MLGYRSLMLPKAMLTTDDSLKQESLIIATSSGEKKYDVSYYSKAALAGAICCSVTHGAMCPVDVVKTKIQLDPVKYNKGLLILLFAHSQRTTHFDCLKDWLEVLAKSSRRKG